MESLVQNSKVLVAAITASLIIIATGRWLNSHVGIYDNRIYRRYKYTALKSSYDEFRLCHLEPGSFGDHIKVSLLHYSFGQHSHPNYKALSYVWGDLKDRQPALIDGQLSSLTANLHDALQHIRDEKNPVVLWIDALSINQEDVLERSRQVQMMKRIFESAESVIAWIGPSYANSNTAMEYIHKYVPSTSTSSTIQATSEKSESEIRISVQNLFRRTYWERIWIIQELASARQCQVQCGRMRIPLQAFHVFVQALNSSLDVQNYMSVAKAARLLKLSKLCHAQAPHAQRLVDLLWTTVDFQATDPRDKVYAILGLAGKRDRAAIVPDYTAGNTLPVLLRKLVKHHVETERNLDILCGFPTLGYHGSSRRGSWTPDLYRHTNGLCALAFNASGNRPLEVKFSPNLDLLTVKGLGIGTIDTVIGPFRLALSTRRDANNVLFRNFSNDQSFRAMSIWAPKALGKIHPHADAKRLDEILWKDIIGDQVSMAHDAPDAPCPCGYLELLEALSAKAHGTMLTEAHGKATPAYSGLCGNELCGADEDEANILAHCPASSLSAFTRLSNRCFFVTTEGIVGLGPPDLRRGDTVSVLFGCSLPIILRESGGYHEWVGPAYVYQGMNGEYVDGVNDNSSLVKDFVLR